MWLNSSQSYSTSITYSSTHSYLLCVQYWCQLQHIQVTLQPVRWQYTWAVQPARWHYTWAGDTTPGQAKLQPARWDYSRPGDTTPKQVALQPARWHYTWALQPTRWHYTWAGETTASRWHYSRAGGSSLSLTAETVIHSAVTGSINTDTQTHKQCDGYLISVTTMIMYVRMWHIVV